MKAVIYKSLNIKIGIGSTRVLKFLFEESAKRTNKPLNSKKHRKQGAARFGRLPFFPSILYKRINLLKERAFDDLLFVKQRAYAVCDQERAENAADDDARNRAARKSLAV